MTDAPKPWAVIDVETSCVKVHKKEGEKPVWSPSPWATDDAGNFPIPLLVGMKAVRVEGDCLDTTWSHGIFEGLATTVIERELDSLATLIGHNIKFDAGHVPAINEHTVWDTMIAEYILTAQRSKFASLSDLCKKYTPHMAKEDLIGSNLEVGIPPQELERGELETYLKNDLEVTAEVFKCQWALCTPEMRGLILVQSTASLAYGEIERNGLTLDVPYTIVQRDYHAQQMADAVEAFKAMYAAEFLDHAPVRQTLDRLQSVFTPTILSAALFGTPTEIPELVLLTDAEKVGLGKRRKFKKVTLPGLAYKSMMPPVFFGSKEHASRRGIWSIDDMVLDNLIASGTTTQQAIAVVVKEYRKHAKIHGTYLDAWLTEIEQYTDRRLHPKIHSTTTDTGRTSSSGPNVQNIPDEGRACVMSRFEGGELLEADFKQLEVMGLAELSGCPALLRALRAGDDIHYLSGQKVYGWTSPSQMTKDHRRIVKTINFGLIYGGSAGTLSKQAGVEKQLAQDLIDGFYSRFPGVKDWQEKTYAIVVNDPDEVHVYEGPNGTETAHVITSLTGRMYAFPLEDPPSWMPAHVRLKKGKSPSPTKVKNYPVQGYATGDIVPLAVMLYWQEIHRQALQLVCLPVAAVHDSVLTDCLNRTAAERAAAILTEVVEKKLPAALASLWGIKLTVPLALDIHHLKTWKHRR